MDRNCLVDVRAKEVAVKSFENETVKLNGPLAAFMVAFGGVSQVTHAWLAGKRKHRRRSSSARIWLRGQVLVAMSEGSLSICCINGGAGERQNEGVKREKITLCDWGTE